jgi:cystathionine beta-synthase
MSASSSGTAVAAALRVARDLSPSDLVVVLLPDSGRSYLSKVFSDGWMRRWGFLEDPLDGARTVADALGATKRTGSTPLSSPSLRRRAVRAGLIAVNPGRFPELPKAARPRPQVWTPALTERWELSMLEASFEH